MPMSALEEQRFDLRTILETAPRDTITGAAYVYVIIKDETANYRFCEVFVINSVTGVPQPMKLEGLISAVTGLARIPMFHKVARRAGTLKLQRKAAYASDEIELALNRAVFGVDKGRIRCITF